MGLFKRLQKKKKLEKLQEIEEQYQGSLEAEHPEMNESEAGHLILKNSQEIIREGKELSEQKREYTRLTNYLKDIETIESIPEEGMNKIQELANNVQQLSNSREEYLKAERKISDVQFIQMEEYEDEMPEMIKRFQENETYQATVNRDMKYLEGEKSEWYYYCEALKEEQHKLKILSIVMLVIYAMAFCTFLTVSMTTKLKNADFIFMGLMFLGALGVFAVFTKHQNNKRDIKQSEVNINYAISLLNTVKFKYVNITNAVDYEKERFHVNNSYELSYIWQKYLEAVSERERFSRMNTELDYFTGALERVLCNYQLYDTKIWATKTHALLDHKEMVEVKHDLLVRRQKLRERMEHLANSMRLLQDEMKHTAKKQKNLPPQAKEIIRSIDQLMENA